MISPTIGRMVLFHPGYPTDQPYAAIVAFVHSDREINVAFFYENGVASNAQRVILVQEGDAPPKHGRYAEWMPYQVGQVKKYEEKKPFALGDKPEGIESVPLSSLVG